MRRFNILFGIAVAAGFLSLNFNIPFPNAVLIVVAVTGGGYALYGLIQGVRIIRSAGRR